MSNVPPKMVLLRVCTATLSLRDGTLEDPRLLLLLLQYFSYNLSNCFKFHAALHVKHTRSQFSTQLQIPAGLRTSLRLPGWVVYSNGAFFD